MRDVGSLLDSTICEVYVLRIVVSLEYMYTREHWVVSLHLLDSV